jgi:WD40 repeat protein/tetratricopeptide (TPR) repeat protein
MLPVFSGQEVGRPAVPGYELLEVVGKGGMGVVYRARQLGLGRIVALKMILHAEYAGADDRRRFQGEAEAVARLQHRHIVQIHEVGEAGGVPYFSLEYCSGGSLEEQLDGTPWEAPRAAQLVETLAGAVAAAHAAGIIHRDLKPGNVLLTEDGTPKVADFGLAKRLDVPGQTQTGAIVGTPSYMAPEQAGGKKDVGPAADVYALGAILYELLAGRPPFKAATPLDTMLQVLSEEPVAVRRLQPKVPRDLETVCHKCLEKDPKKRYGSAAALTEDLQRFLAGEPVAARPVGMAGRLLRRARRRPGVAALVLGMLLLAAAGAAGILSAYGEAIVQRNGAQREADKARREKARADEQTEDARRAKEHAERMLYFSQVGHADSARLAGNVTEAEQVLDSTRLDLRGWEYHYLRRRIEGTPLTLRGHTWPVTAVSYSPDGTHLASASGELEEPGEVKIWDTRSGAEVATLRGHTDKVTAVSYSPDGTRVASASYDKTVKVWDVRTGAEILTLRWGKWFVNAVSYSPDGTRLAGASGSEVKLWDARSGADVATLRGHTGPVRAVSYSPDGTRLASASWSLDNTVKVWDARTGAEILTLRGHTAWVNAVSYNPDGTRLAGAWDDHTVKVWDARSGAELFTLRGHTQPVSAVSYNPDGTRLASASKDSTVKIWDVHTGAELATLRGHTEPVTAVSYSPDGTRLASGSYDHTVKVWDARSGAEVPTLRRHTAWVSAVSYSPDGTRLASASYDGRVKVWDTHSGAELATLRGHTDRVSAVSYSPDGTRLASASWDRTVKVWDARSGAELATLRGHASPVYSVSYSPDGTRLASGSGLGDNTVKVWDVRSGAELLTLRGHRGFVYSVSYSPDGTRLASASMKTVKLWDAHSGAEILTLSGHTNYVNAVCYSADGTRLASASEDSTVKIWDAHTGAELATLRGHTEGVTAVSYSLDGTRLVSASADILNDTIPGELKIWDAHSGALILTLRGHTGDVTGMCYSPDGTRLASASKDGTVKIWDARSAATIASHRVSSSRVLKTMIAVSYSPDSTQLASASEDNTIKVWDARTGAELATLRGHTRQVTSVSYSLDGTRIVSRDRAGQTLVWDAATAKLQKEEQPPPHLLSTNISPDGQFAAMPEGNFIRLLRRTWPGASSPWAEDTDRHQALAPAWHAEDAASAEGRNDWFAAAFHRRRLANLRPGDAVNHVHLAQVCAKLGRWQEALDTCDRLLAADPKLAPAYLERARLLLALGRKAAADADTLKALALATHSRLGWPDFASEQAAAGQLALAALYQASEPEHLRRLAWTEQAAGDGAAARGTLRRLHTEHRGVADLKPLFHLSAALVSGLAVIPTPAPGAGSAVASTLLRREEARRAAVVVQAAALLPNSGIPAAELVDLARLAMEIDPQSWQYREALGAALYRAGQYAEAVRELGEAVRLHGDEGSLWAQLFLALAHQRLGHAEQAKQLSQQAGSLPGWSWEEQVIERQLQGELGLQAPGLRMRYGGTRITP